MESHKTALSLVILMLTFPCTGMCNYMDLAHLCERNGNELKCKYSGPGEYATSILMEEVTYVEFSTQLQNGIVSCKDTLPSLKRLNFGYSRFDRLKACEHIECATNITVTIVNQFSQPILTSSVCSSVSILVCMKSKTDKDQILIQSCSTSCLKHQQDRDKQENNTKTRPSKNSSFPKGVHRVIINKIQMESINVA